MPHKNRSRRRANLRRRLNAENRRELPPDKQRERAAERAAAKLKLYPVPPLYRPAHNAKQPEQPWCYLTPWERAEAVKGAKKRK